MGDVCDECPIDPENDADNDSVCGDVDQCNVENAIGFDADNNGCIDNINTLEASVVTLVAEDVIDTSMQNSVVSKLENVAKSMDKENICASVNQLEAFINQVNAQKGKKISEDAADELIIYTNSVIDYQLSQLPPGEGC